jgi:hypothetical protein
MADIQYVSFVAADGTDINGRSLSIGAGTITGGSGNCLVTSNRARLALSAGTYHFPTVTPDDYTVKASARLLTTADSPLIALTARAIAGDLNNRWTALFDPTNGSRIRKTVSGTATVLETDAFTFTTGVDYEFWFAVSGNDKSTWIDGVKISESLGDTAVPTGDNAQFGLALSTSGTSTTAWHINWVSVDDSLPGATNAARSFINGALRSPLLNGGLIR